MASSARTGADRRRGLALITILLLLILVTALGLMALSVTGMDMTLAGTGRRTTQSFQAATGGADIGLQVVRDTLDRNALPTGYPATVVVDNTAGSGLLPSFVEELTGGAGGTDTPAASPDITVAGLFPNQTVRIDADYGGTATFPGSAIEDFAGGYHKKIAGAGCSTGGVYYVDSQASGPLQTQARVTQAYFYCP